MQISKMPNSVTPHNGTRAEVCVGGGGDQIGPKTALVFYVFTVILSCMGFVETQGPIYWKISPPPLGEGEISANVI